MTRTNTSFLDHGQVTVPTAEIINTGGEGEQVSDRDQKFTFEVVKSLIFTPPWDN